jgi:hypothetical protein
MRAPNGHPAGVASAAGRAVDDDVLRSAVALQHEVAAFGPDLAAAMQRIADRTREMTGATAAQVTMVDGDDLVTGATSGPHDLRLPDRFAATGALTLHAIRSGRSVLCEATERDERADARAWLDAHRTATV